MPRPDLSRYKLAKYALNTWLLSGRLRLRAYSYARPLIRERKVGSHTQLVIEGYPRSANTYALAAFQHWNGADIPVAHHLHSPVSLEAAARAGCPAILLLRNPVDAISSELVRNPGLSVSRALDRYRTFHRRAEPLGRHVVVAPFEVVVDDFGAVIAEVNNRFDSKFRFLPPSASSEIRIFETIERMERIDSGGLPVREHMVARPSGERLDQKAALSDSILGHPTYSSVHECYVRLFESSPFEGLIVP